MFTSDDQFQDGFYYGRLREINGTITGAKIRKIFMPTKYLP